MPLTPTLFEKYHSVTLCADSRFGAIHEKVDQVWEIHNGCCEPDSLNLQTSLGLRVREFKIFPRFIENNLCVTSPEEFWGAPRIVKKYANYFVASFIPFKDINVSDEVMVPASQLIAGKLTFLNEGNTPRSLRFELATQLVNLDGNQCLEFTNQSHSVYLTGKAGGLSPALVMLGGVTPGMDPYTSLNVSFQINPGENRSIVWAAASFSKREESIQAAVHFLSHPWEPQAARIDLRNQMDLIEFQTGDAGLDSVLLESQKAAYQFIVSPQQTPSQAYFVSHRNKDAVLSHPDPATGMNPMLADYLTHMILPQSPNFAQDYIRDSLSSLSEERAGAFLPVPWLGSLACGVDDVVEDPAWLKEVYPGLLKAFWRWFSPENDRDGDSFPEYSHPLQTCYEKSPVFDQWCEKARGVDLQTIETPALAAQLYHECSALMRIAEKLGDKSQMQLLQVLQDRIRRNIEECWDEKSGMYLPRDRDSHRFSKGILLGKYHGEEANSFSRAIDPPARLLITIHRRRLNVSAGSIQIEGSMDDQPLEETLKINRTAWVDRTACLTSQHVYSQINRLGVYGLDPSDRIEIRTVDHQPIDLSLFLPLWVRIPSPDRAALMVRKLISTKGFSTPYGLSMLSPENWKRYPESCGENAHLPLLKLILEGMLNYGYMDEVVDVTKRFMELIKHVFLRDGSFRKSYNVVNGSASGGKDYLEGLLPIGLFLKIIGVQILSPEKVILTGKNPFDRPIKVIFRGLTITRDGESTLVQFPNGQVITATGTEKQLITLHREKVPADSERRSMTTSEIPKEVNRLLFAVVQAQDADNAVQELNKLNVVVTRLPSVGGFLGRRNVTLLIGTPEKIEATVMSTLQENCRQRVEYIAIPLESAPLPLPTPTPVTIGGATVFSMELEYFEVI